MYICYTTPAQLSLEYTDNWSKPNSINTHIGVGRGGGWSPPNIFLEGAEPPNILGLILADIIISSFPKCSKALRSVSPLPQCLSYAYDTEVGRVWLRHTPLLFRPELALPQGRTDAGLGLTAAMALPLLVQYT